MCKVAEGSRLLQSAGIELRDRLGSAWREEWAVSEEEEGQESEEEDLEEGESAGEGEDLVKEVKDLLDDSRVFEDAEISPWEQLTTSSFLIRC